MRLRGVAPYVSLAAVACSVVAAMPATARADVFCVRGPGQGACASIAQTHTTLADALTAANATQGRDRVEIGSGTLTLPSTVFDTVGVDIVGAGLDQTTLTSGDADGPILTVQPTSSVSDLTLRLAAGIESDGLVLWGAGTRVGISAEPGRTEGTGVWIMPDATLRHGSVSLDTGLPGLRAIGLSATPGSFATLDDANIVAGTGIESFGAGWGRVRRAHVVAGEGIAARCGRLYLHTALIEVAHDGGRALTVSPASVPCSDATLEAHHVTATPRAGLADTTGLDVAGGVDHPSSALIASTSIWGFGTDVRSVGDGGSAEAKLSYSNVGTRESGPGGTIVNGQGMISWEPMFSGPDDFRPAIGSPLIDAGPFFTDARDAFESGVDLRGFSFWHDGDGNGIVREDIGAYERRGLSIWVQASAESVDAGGEVTFRAFVTPDEDAFPNPVTWLFTDGSRATGETVTKTLRRAGRYEARAEVTDSSGRSSSRAVIVTVREPRVDETRPRLRSVSLSQRRFAATPQRPRSGAMRHAARKARTPVGTRFRFALSERALVTIELERVRIGVRVRGRCLAKPPVGRRGPHCTKQQPVGDLRRRLGAGRRSVPFSGWVGKRKLPPGRYQASLSATDAAGNLSDEHRLRFRVVER